MSNIWKNLIKMGEQTARGGIPQAPKGAGPFGALLLGGGILSYGLYQSLYTVDGGHRAVIFNRLTGISPDVRGEGTHIRIPYIEKPTVFDIRTKPTAIRAPTGTKDLQIVDITLRILFKPDPSKLHLIFSTLGTNYADRVLPSIGNETLKSVIAQFNASQLITQREQISQLIRRNLSERAGEFNILIEDVSITHLTFGSEYTAAIEAKQVAQQESERAKYLVKQALEDKKSTIIKAQGEAKSAEMIGEAVRREPGYLDLRQMEAAREIAALVAKSPNRVYLDANTLLLNILSSSSSANLREDKSSS